MGKRSIEGRLDHLETICGSRINHALVRQIAADEGISESELLAEAAEMTAICRERGITNEAAMARYWADALGISQAEVDAWTERYRAWL